MIRGSHLENSLILHVSKNKMNCSPYQRPLIKQTKNYIWDKHLKLSVCSYWPWKRFWEEEKRTGGGKAPLWRCGFGQTSPILTMKPPKTLKHIIIITTKLYVLIPPSFLGYVHKQPTHFIQKQSSTQATGGAEKDVVYNWIGLLRTYTRLLLLTFLLTDWFKLYNSMLKMLRNNQVCLYLNVCFVTKVKGQPSAPAVRLFHFKCFMPDGLEHQWPAKVLRPVTNSLTLQDYKWHTEILILGDIFISKHWN